MASEKKKNRLRIKRRKPTKHHIIPKSRTDTSNDLENIAKIRAKEHEEYHKLFSNKTPAEITEYLVSNYWGGQWGCVVKTYEENEASMDNRKIPNKYQRELWPRMHNGKKRRHSMIPGPRGTASGIEGTTRIESRERENYEKLLNDRTPKEILEHLVFNCWNGQWDYVAQACEENRPSMDNRKIPNENQGELWTRGYGSKDKVKKY